jgi:hypothetical protein
MRQLTCGGLTNSNTGPLGQASSNDEGRSLMNLWKKAGVVVVTVAIVTLGEHDR